MQEVGQFTSRILSKQCKVMWLIAMILNEKQDYAVTTKKATIERATTAITHKSIDYIVERVKHACGEKESPVDKKS